MPDHDGRRHGTRVPIPPAPDTPAAPGTPAPDEPDPRELEVGLDVEYLPADAHDTWFGDVELPPSPYGDAPRQAAQSW